MVTYTNTSFYYSPSGKLVTQTYTFIQANEDETAETVAVTTPHVNIERS